jgi:ribosomal-protein-alanine N-acetyltransferase
MKPRYTFILETKRLVLRRQVIEDLNALWALYSDPEITKYIPDAPKTYDEAKKELEWHMNGHPSNPDLGLWATIHKKTGKFIGRCGLLPWTIDGQQEVEVAYTIARDFWGQGFGTEAAQAIVQYAFETLKLKRLICMIEPENKLAKPSKFLSPPQADGVLRNFAPSGTGFAKAWNPRSKLRSIL